MRIEDPEQRPDRETGASTSRDAGNDSPPRPAESSVSVDQPTWAIPRVTGGDPESRLGRKEKQRGSGSVSLMAKKAMHGWRPKRKPKLSGISDRRESIVCSTEGGEWRIVDSWGDKESENHQHRETCGSDIEQSQPLAEDDFLLDVNGGILDLRPTSQQGKRWNLSDKKKISAKYCCLSAKKRPNLVIGCGKCLLFCTVLYHEQIRSGAWFLHDLSGNALQLSLPCMIRLECRHDVFHTLGNARDKRDGERVSFLTNSPHFARKVEGSNRRENLDSEICEGLRHKVGDAGHASSTMHMASGTQVRPFDLY